MDPFEQRLSAAGATWRQSQPEPPDLDRLVAGLAPRRRSVFAPRLAFALATGLLVLAAIAVAPGVGGLLRGPGIGVPVGGSPTAAPGACAGGTDCASHGPQSPAPTSTPTPRASVAPSDDAIAKSLVERYEAALVAGEWQTAFDLLAPSSPTRGMGFDAFAAERAPYFESVDGRYTIGTPSQDVPDWTTYAPLIDGADTSRAFLVDVQYPALSGNNAGFEQFVVAPDASGTWWIWPVR